MEAALAVATILIAPLLATMGVSFKSIQSMLFRIVAIVILLLATRKGPIVALLTFLAVFTVFVERNHQILVNLPGIPSTRVSTSSPGKPILVPPMTPSLQYDPPQSDDTKEFPYESAEDIHDNNPNLSEAPSSDDAPDFFESRGLA
jgi:hypothetical protein